MGGVATPANHAKEISWSHPQCIVPAMHNEPTPAELLIAISKTGQRLEQFAQGFEQMEHRFERMEQRFEQMEHCFERMDHRFEQMDHRFEQMEHRLDQTMSAMIDLQAATAQGFRGVDARFDHLDDRVGTVETQITSVRGEVSGLQRFMVDTDRRLSILEHAPGTA